MKKIIIIIFIVSLSYSAEAFGQKTTSCWSTSPTPGTEISNVLVLGVIQFLASGISVGSDILGLTRPKERLGWGLTGLSIGLLGGGITMYISGRFIGNCGYHRWMHGFLLLNIPLLVFSSFTLLMDRDKKIAFNFGFWAGIGTFLLSGISFTALMIEEPSYTWAIFSLPGIIFGLVMVGLGINSWLSVRETNKPPRLTFLPWFSSSKGRDGVSGGLSVIGTF